MRSGNRVRLRSQTHDFLKFHAPTLRDNRLYIQIDLKRIILINSCKALCRCFLERSFAAATLRCSYYNISYFKNQLFHINRPFVKYSQKQAEKSAVNMARQILTSIWKYDIM